MKKILIITPYFSPENAIAAVRPTKFVKYLAQEGYEVTVLSRIPEIQTIDTLLQADERYAKKIYRVQNGKSFIRLYEFIYRRPFACQTKNLVETSHSDHQSLSGVFVLLKRLFAKRLYKYTFLLENYDFYRQARKWLKTTQPFDVVFSTYGPFSSHLIGLFLKKKGKAKRWIADFRDQVIFWDEKNFLFRMYSQRYENRITRNADVITAVSQGVLETLPSSACRVVLPNGFDPAERSVLQNSKSKKRNNKLSFLYAGTLYQGKSDLSLLFKILHELSEANQLDLQDIELHYAGSNIEILLEQAAMFHLESLIVDHGFVSREESLQLQRSCSILLLASWNTYGNFGVVTGKFLEYMMMEKPIIALISGDVPQSRIKEMIRDSRIGVCCEEAALLQDYPFVKETLLSMYREFKETRTITLNPDRDYIERFNYKNITRDLITLL